MISGTPLMIGFRTQNISNSSGKLSEIWDEASTEEKRRYIGNILVNAAGTRICSDDV